MALKCPSCGSLSTQALVHNYQCNDCGALATFDGKPAEPGMDDATRAVHERALAPRQTNIVGNFADLQRLGGAQATESGTVGDAVKLPAGVTPEQADAGREAAAAEAEALGDDGRVKVGADAKGGDAVTTTSSSAEADTRRSGFRSGSKK